MTWGCDGVAQGRDVSRAVQGMDGESGLMGQQGHGASGQVDIIHGEAGGGAARGAAHEGHLHDLAGVGSQRRTHLGAAVLPTVGVEVTGDAHGFDQGTCLGAEFGIEPVVADPAGIAGVNPEAIGEEGLLGGAGQLDLRGEFVVAAGGMTELGAGAMGLAGNCKGTAGAGGGLPAVQAALEAPFGDQLRAIGGLHRGRPQRLGVDHPGRAEQGRPGEHAAQDNRQEQDNSGRTMLM